MSRQKDETRLAAACCNESSHSCKKRFTFTFVKVRVDGRQQAM